jgi:hypothetical protein
MAMGHGPKCELLEPVCARPTERTDWLDEACQEAERSKNSTVTVNGRRCLLENNNRKIGQGLVDA